MCCPDVNIPHENLQYDDSLRIHNQGRDKWCIWFAKK
jgi:hypothetical protein